MNMFRVFVALLLVAVLALSVSAFAEFDRVLVEATPYGIEGFIYLDANNENNLKVSMFIPELGILARQGPFEEPDDDLNVRFYEELAPGEYMIRIVVQNDEGRTVIWRPVEIK